MLKKYSLVITAFCMGAFAIPASAEVSVGSMAPEIEAVDVMSGEAFKLSDHKGKVVVLEWTNHGCPFVVKHYGSGNMQKVQKEALAQDNVEWVTIVSSAPGRQGHVTAEEAKAIVEKEGASVSAKLLDETGEIGKAYGAQTTPHMFVIDAEGKLAYMGAIDDNSSPNPKTVEGAKNYVLAALSDIAAGKPVEMAQTRSYGCGVKY
ncbi:MAG: thioredoxin family protein [Micavibrio sp. TMED27]|nr:thioredoxin family protein [Micavibrio sp.]OUT91241.1 MAG: thioredoxin family protein [Micavibrio sp. TMED27]|tara:strand:+ start:302 stop:916 length:615 start_codon:yes stop_codon:yes gene_type:complete